MKKIHLIRHAKSSPADGPLPDIERSLNDRGIKTCLFMAHYIYEAGCRFKNVYCSPAVRACSTIENISVCYDGFDVKWKIENELYTFDCDVLLKWLCDLDESVSELVIVGHNPALTELANILGDRIIDNIPTCGYVQLSAMRDFPWKNLYAAAFELTSFLSPKNLGFS